MAAQLPSKPEYLAREQQAPQSVREDIEALRERGRKEGWTFRVGVTSVVGQTVDDLARTDVPENVLTLAKSQNALARRANALADESALLKGVSAGPNLGNCDPNKVASTGGTKGR